MIIIETSYIYLCFIKCKIVKVVSTVVRAHVDLIVRVCSVVYHGHRLHGKLNVRVRVGRSKSDLAQTH